MDYFFTSDSTDGSKYKELLLDYMKKAHRIGLTIHGIVSDMGAPNQAMWSAFGIYAGKNLVINSCEHPVNSELRLFFFTIRHMPSKI